MNAEAKDKLVKAWVAEFSQAEPPSDRAGMSAADEAFFYAAYRKPELCWDLVQRVFALTQHPQALAALAAGPLEELLAQHGPAFIERVEALANKSPAFLALLGGVYRSSMQPEVWERIVRLRQGRAS